MVKWNMVNSPMCGNRSIPSPDIRNFYGQKSGVASYHGSYIYMMRCRSSYSNQQWMIVVAEEDCVNNGRTTSVDVVIAAHRR